MADQAATAEQIQFTHAGTVSGQLNGVAFGPSLVTFLGTGDTSARYSTPQGFAIEHTPGCRGLRLEPQCRRSGCCG